MLDGAFEAARDSVKGKGVLLLDDLYRSGATANAVTLALIAGGASPRLFSRRHPNKEQCMTSVFIGGSRRISRMNGELSRRLDNIIQKQLRVLIGDANGFDRLAQAYLAGHHYPSVLIYCTNGVCRNNVGHWPLHAVEYHGRDRGLEFYTVKDDAMLQDADFGLFGWDGKSKGTLRNVRIMAERQTFRGLYFAH